MYLFLTLRRRFSKGENRVEGFFSEGSGKNKNNSVNAFLKKKKNKAKNYDLTN